MPEWLVDVDGRSAYCDLTSEDFTIEDAGPLLGDLIRYHEEEQVDHVILRVAPGRPPTIEVVVQGLRSQSEAIGVDFTVREAG